MTQRSFAAAGSSGQSSYQRIVVLGAALWIAAAGTTWNMCVSMTDMLGVPMPGGWNLSMMWMRMPGQSWLDVFRSFESMWIVMTIAMMLPSITPALCSYHRNATRAAVDGPGLLVVLFGAGYLFVWSALGLATFACGVTLVAIAIHLPSLAHGVPIAAGAIVAIAGSLQFTSWKMRGLACYRAEIACAGAYGIGAASAWREGIRLGIRLGIRCARCCASLMAIQMVVGMMNLGVMLVVTVAIAVERRKADATSAARIIGLSAIAAGVFLIAGAVVSN